MGRAMAAGCPSASFDSSSKASSSADHELCSRPLRGAAAVDRVEEEADHLRRHEEDLRAVRQADEQVEAAEDSDRPDKRRQRRSERRSRSGSRRRRTSIAAQTATNAASVPAFASAAIEASGIRPAKTEVTIAVKIVIRTGVPRRDTRARLLGRSPSRATVKKIRLWP